MKTSQLFSLIAAMFAVVLCQGSALAELSFDFTTPGLSQEVEIGIIANFDNVLHNTGDADDTYTVSFVKNAPADWTATMCIGTSCLPPWETEADIDLTVGSEEDIIIDLTPGSAGIGSITVVVTSHGNPALTESITFNVNTPGMGEPNFDFAASDHGAIADILELHAFHTTITNNSGLPDNYSVTMVKNATEPWTGTMCAGELCYPPFITDIDIPLADGELINLDIDLTPGELGEGTLVITVTSDNNPAMSITRSFTVITPGLDVLLVAGDNDMGNDVWYRNALLADGQTVGTWKRQEMGALSNGDITSFNNVVWESGTVDGGLDVYDLAALAYYVQHGGNLFMSGQNLAWESCSTDSPYYTPSTKGWFNAILKTDYADDEFFAENASGPLGDLVTEGLSFNLFGGDGAGNNDSLDGLATVGEGIATLMYDTGGIAATRTFYGDGKTFFAGFAFEGIDTEANRNGFMAQVMAWFNNELTPVGDMVAPLLASIPYASPNPFNPQTSILFEVGGVNSVSGEVVIYNVKGQVVRNLFQGSVSPGPQSMVWNGRNNNGRNMSTGVYFAQVRLNDQSKTVKMTLVK